MAQPSQLTIDGREETLPAIGRPEPVAEPLFAWSESRVPGTLAMTETDPAALTCPGPMTLPGGTPE